MLIINNGLESLDEASFVLVGVEGMVLIFGGSPDIALGLFISKIITQK